MALVGMGVGWWISIQQQHITFTKSLAAIREENDTLRFAVRMIGYEVHDNSRGRVVVTRIPESKEP